MLLGYKSKTLDKDKLNIILDNILNKNSDYTDKKSNLKN